MLEYLNIQFIANTLNILIEFLIFFFPRIFSENKETNICEQLTAKKAKTDLTLKKFFSDCKQKQVHGTYQSTMQ